MTSFDYTLIEGKDLVINESSFFGETVFKNCNITINVTSKFLVTRNLVFINSKIKFKKKFLNYCWGNCFFDSCSFEGKLLGNDFGNWPSYFVRDDNEKIGDIKNCDFSKSDFASCRIIDSDARSNKLPGWPHFTLYEPYLYLEKLRAIKWPDLFGVLFESPHEDVISKISSITWNFEYLNKFTTSDKVYDMLKELPFIEL